MRLHNVCPHVWFNYELDGKKWDKCGVCGAFRFDKPVANRVGDTMTGNRKPSERDDAIQLANKILDRPSADPDDKLALLSRQFLRALEVIEAQEKRLKEVDWEGVAMRDLIEANRDAILKMHEEAARRINKVLIGGGNQHDAEKLVRIGKVLHALTVFHPMHGESWCGWPNDAEENLYEGRMDSYSEFD